MSKTRRPPSPAAVLATVLALIPAAAAQDPPAEPPRDPLDTARQAVDAWVRSDLDRPERLDAAVDAILDAGRAGLELLAAEIDRTSKDDRRRLTAVDSLTTNTMLGFLRRGTESGMVYAGQYDDLKLLEPAAGRFLLGLVVDTPDWFPDDMRQLVVPALRDVLPKGPPAAMLERLTEICADEEFETQALRDQLAYALAQWGRPRFVQARLDELTGNAGEGRSSGELYFVRELARLHYQCRDYVRAAERWHRYVAGSRALGNEPRPIELYDAACCYALAGRVDDGLAAIEACLSAVAAGRSDSTVEITREMLANDPDLRALRPLPRFRDAVRTAFGDGEDAGAGSGERRRAPSERR